MEKKFTVTIEVDASRTMNFMVKARDRNAAISASMERDEFPSDQLVRIVDVVEGWPAHLNAN